MLDFINNVRLYKMHCPIILTAVQCSRQTAGCLASHQDRVLQMRLHSASRHAKCAPITSCALSAHTEMPTTLLRLARHVRGMRPSAVACW